MSWVVYLVPSTRLWRPWRLKEDLFLLKWGRSLTFFGWNQSCAFTWVPSTSVYQVPDFPHCLLTEENPNTYTRLTHKMWVYLRLQKSVIKVYKFCRNKWEGSGEPQTSMFQLSNCSALAERTRDQIPVTIFTPSRYICVVYCCRQSRDTAGQIIVGIKCWCTCTPGLHCMNFITFNFLFNTLHAATLAQKTIISHSSCAGIIPSGIILVQGFKTRLFWHNRWKINLP